MSVSFVCFSNFTYIFCCKCRWICKTITIPLSSVLNGKVPKSRLLANFVTLSGANMPRTARGMTICNEICPQNGRNTAIWSCCRKNPSSAQNGACWVCVCFICWCFKWLISYLLGRNLWKVVTEALQCKKLARKRRVLDDDFRRPHIDLLYGADSWVEHVDNGIKYIKNTFL